MSTHLLERPEAVVTVRADEPADLREARDRDLVWRIKAGDENAFRGLFRRYGPAALGLARRVVRQPHLAEETVQEAFLSVWRNAAAFDESRGSVRSWLMGAVHNRAVDAVRREEAQRRRAEDAAADLDRERIEELLAAKSLDGLEPADVAELERLQASHGPRWEECRRLEDELAEVAGRLAFAAAAAEVPAGFEDRLVAAATVPERRGSHRARRWGALVAAAA